MTSIVLISDTHNKHKQLDLGGPGDLLIHAGDATSKGMSHELEHFLKWYGKQDFEVKVLIPGNHDFGMEADFLWYDAMAKSYGVTLLNDSGTEYRDIKIWGSPVQPEFHGWAFNRARTPEEVATKGHSFIGPHWDQIPSDTDLLITHGPPQGILDMTHRGVAAGCKLLLEKVKEVKPALHVFGHLHEARGIHDNGDTVFVNASSLDLSYQLQADGGVYRMYWEEIIRGII